MKLTDEQRQQLEEIYHILQQEYERVAAALQFSCDDCEDNCCDSYFRHHTYIEWLYFREGLQTLSDMRRQELEMRAKAYLAACAKAEAQGKRPQVNCPLLDDGRCTLYKHRLLVCRTHGVPALMVRPDKKRLRFPGCFRCQQIVRQHFDSAEHAPTVNRTPLLLRLARLENELLGGRQLVMPKVNMTIAEMILSAPQDR